MVTNRHHPRPHSLEDGLDKPLAPLAALLVLAAGGVGALAGNVAALAAAVAVALAIFAAGR
jgi:hypothetical protein